MNSLFLFFSLILVAVQFAISRRWVYAPLLIAAFLLPNVAADIGGFSFPACRLLIAAGLIRAVSTRKIAWSIRNPLDGLILCWSFIAILSAFFHDSLNENPLTVRLSSVYDLAGTYLYARSYVKTIADLKGIIRCLAIVVIPLALIMIFEYTTGKNFYAALGAAVSNPWARDGRLRASGPFGGAILAGSAAGTVMPLILSLLWSNRRLAIISTVSCVIVVFCSASSGPLVALFAGLLAVILWRWRRSIGKIRAGVILALIGLHLIMKAPVWYLIARIDFIGGSSSWGRAELITQALSHLSEWWLVGTDYTRHWMPYGIEWSAAHTDITNYYIKMGVWGGLPLMLAFIAILYKAFQFLGRTMRALPSEGPFVFVLWCTGSALFAHAVTFFSVSYYDQSNVPLFLLIGAVPGIWAAVTKQCTPTNVDTIPDGRLYPAPLYQQKSGTGITPWLEVNK